MMPLWCGEKHTASTNNDNLRSHFDVYKCKEGKGRESLRTQTRVEKCGDGSLCTGGGSSLHALGAEAMWRRRGSNSSVSASGSIPQRNRAGQPVRSALFVGWGPEGRLFSPGPRDAHAGFRHAALLSSHVKMQSSVANHMTPNLRRCGWPATPQTAAGI